MSDLVTRVGEAWPGRAPRRCGCCRASCPTTSCPAIEPTGAAIPIGIDEDTLSPVFLDFDSEPHFIVFGDTESGKSNLLRLIARGITTRCTPDQAQIISSTTGAACWARSPRAHQIGYVMSSVGAPGHRRATSRAALRERLAGIQVDPAAGEVPDVGTVRGCSCCSTTTTWSPPAATR